MKLVKLFPLLLACLVCSPSQAQEYVMKSPEAFLGRPLGSRFTPHHLIVDYFQYVDAASPKVELMQYGTTYEHRPLMAAVISTPDNLKKLESIRLNHLRSAGLETGSAVNDNVVIVYLSYSVHGNEPAGAESSMAVLYELVREGSRAEAWLKNTIVILDPVLNPDGFDRFVQWSNSNTSSPANPRPETREHDEPWPGGRSNHYYFDLNRDWAWQTQKESRDRLAFYLKWMPHVHADVHEMSSEAPYYFAPAAQPYHPNVTKWQTDFQHLTGKNHATYFDKEGWRYFTKERFDLFYPSYGDTYPTFSGAIGMTYEQGGGSFANRCVLLENGDTLTLADRIAHHRVASISTVEVASNNASRLIREFNAYFEAGTKTPPGETGTYVISSQNHPGRIEALLYLLNQHDIRYGYLSSDQPGLKGFAYSMGQEDKFDAFKGDVVIPARQPKAVLTHILMEPEGQLLDSMTYDITAWSLPMAYGLKAYATAAALPYDSIRPFTPATNLETSKPYAYALRWGSMSAATVLATVLSTGIVARYSMEPFTAGGIDFPRGTVLLMRGDNRKMVAFDKVIESISTSEGVALEKVQTGFVDKGRDFGSDDYRLIRRPEILTIAGPEVRSSNLGEIWHFFEEELRYPVNIVLKDQLANVPLESYNTLILPEGYYSLNGSERERIQRWLQNGGKIIAIGNAIQKLTTIAGVSIGVKIEEPTDTTGSEDLIHHPLIYTSVERASLSDDIPGTIFRATIDTTNPLTYGLGETYWTLRTGTSQYNWLPGQGNALFLHNDPVYFGFAGYKALETTRRTLVAGQESIGQGSAVYLPDNPLFRAFWYSGKVLFANALFF